MIDRYKIKIFFHKFNAEEKHSLPVLQQNDNKIPNFDDF